MFKSIPYDDWMQLADKPLNCWRDDNAIGAYDLFINGYVQGSIANVEKHYPHYKDKWNCKYVYNMTLNGCGFLNEPLKATTLDEAKAEYEELLTDKFRGFKRGYELNAQRMEHLIRIMEGGHK